MKLTNKLLERVREIIPIEHAVIRKIMNKCDIHQLLNVLESELPNVVKREYVNHINLHQNTLDVIWEKYQGDMWVTTEIYGKFDDTIT